MRFIVSFIMLCAVWFAASQAMAEVDAQAAAGSFFTCVHGGISFSAESSTTTVGFLSQIAWDWDDDGVYDEMGTWNAKKSIPNHNWPDGGVYYVTVKVWNSEGEWDTVTSMGPFWVAEPVISADPLSGRRPLVVDFSVSDGLPPETTRAYKWYFNWDEPGLPTGTPDSTDPAPTWEYDLPPGTYHCFVLMTYGGNDQWVCNDVVHIVITEG